MSCRCLALALLGAIWHEILQASATISAHGVSYFVKHFLCTVYLTYKTRRSLLRFPEPEIFIKEYTPINSGLIYPDNEWEQERPKSARFLKSKEDLHIFEGSHIESGSSLLLRLNRLQEGLCQAFVVLQLNDGQLLTLQNEVRLDLSDHVSYHGCGLKLECLAPMRRWRIAFNGLMANAEGEDVHVKFGAIWIAASHVFEYPQQMSIEAMADSLSHLNPFTMLSQVESIYKDEFAYSQPGHIDAQITVNGADAKEVHLWGSRMHFSGRLEPRHEVHRFGYFRNGHRLHIISRKVEDKLVVMGSMFDPSTKTLPITAEELSDTRITAKTRRMTYSVLARQTTFEPIPVSTTHPQINDRFAVSKQEATLNGQPGVILTLNVHRYNRPRLVLPDEYQHQCVDPDKTVSALVLSTSEEDCKRSDLTGGKGSSLAVLTSISKQFHSFTVPRALVLTTNAYELFAEQPVVRDAIESLTECVLGCPSNEELRRACDVCVGTVASATVPITILRALEDKMTHLMGRNQSLRVAVRSSAVGEDSEEMSAAGQMTTYLGVPAENIAVVAATAVKCWASQFSFTAVNYKRQYGQTVASNMAVVIQEMVPAEAAGVMFTCNPVTSSPETITITANYGLGESVVSASAEPDTFMIRRARDGTQLSLVETIVGKKKSLIQQTSTGGTEQVDVSDEDAQKTCISSEAVERLASIGHQVESCFTTARDIEWALLEDRFYLLQSRPVTSITKETDFEIANDCNSRLLSEGDILSRATMAEIFPGALSVLGPTITDAFFGVFCREFMLKFRSGSDLQTSLYSSLTMSALRKQIFLPASDRQLESPIEKAMMYASYGRDVSQDEVMKKGVVRTTGKKDLLTKLKGLIGIAKLMLMPNPIIQESSEFSKSFEVYQNENLSAAQQLRHILASLVTCKTVAMALWHGFMDTAINDAFVMNTLAMANNGEINADILTSTAELLQAGEIESVDVPLSLQRLGAGLSRSPDRERFINMTPEDALEWLQTSDTEDAKRFRDFLEKHGHRCVKEFDVFIQPWAMQPTKLIKTLQVAASTPHDPKPPVNQSYDLDQLAGVQLGFIQRRVLDFLIPRARRGVANREIAKSAIIRVIHKLRLALYRLADLMVNEGRIPHRELLFFLHFDEIRQLIGTRSPNIIARAIRRYRLHPTLDSERYPILQIGYPRKLEPVVFANTLLELKGTPVCQGVIEGPARVITHFDKEAHLITKGDILITTATDTGWTPYFPILGGVVTEVGGLVSHGAVVAREYGLPCVVGIDNATQIFKSGDRLRLNGGKGTLQKIDQIDS